jgi:hypothetical protein
MMTAMGKRMTRVETKVFASDRICIWCWEPADVPATVEALIAQGVLREADRDRCAHWSEVKDGRMLRHEDHVDILDTEEMLRDVRAGRVPKAMFATYRPPPRFGATLEDLLGLGSPTPPASALYFYCY